MGKRLFFLYKKNKKRIKGLKKDDIILYLDEDGEDNKNTIGYYSNKILDKSGQTRWGYNTKWIQKWAFQKRGNKKSFAQELIYDNISLWYPIEFFIQGDVGQLGYELSVPGITFYIDVIREVINDVKPSEIIIENKETEFNKIVTKICEKQGIRISDLRLRSKKKSLITRIVNNPLMIRNYIKTRILLRIIIGKLFCKKMKPEDVLILTSDRLSNKENRTDYYWGPIVKELNKKRVKYKMVEYDRIDSLNSLEQVKKRYIPQKYDAQFIGTYYDKKVIKETKKIVRFLKQKFSELDKKKAFSESFEYKGIKFYDLIRPRLKKIFLTYSYYIADVYAISKAIIEKEKPKIILVDHEKNYYGRALITEAKKKGIISFAFEGELVYENNNYLTQIPIKEILNENTPLWRPIPDKKFLWGSYTREWYKNRNYFPEKNLEVIGAPKYDFLKELNEKDKKEMRRKYGVKDDEKLITIITAHLPWEKEYLSMVFKVLREIKKLKVIIKMHPNEPPQNKKMIERMIKKFKLRGVVVSNENSSELIHASDMTITYWSTLVYECILLNKRTILVDLSGNAAITQPYVKEGLIKPCTNFSEVNKEIKNCLLKNKKMSTELRRKFIKKYLYSDDGKASERAVKKIKAVLERN